MSQSLTIDEIANSPIMHDCSRDLIKTFVKFHNENPAIYKLFERFSFDAKRSGRSIFSHWMIMNRIRWYSSVETTGDDFKISNDLIAVYARYFVLRNPEFEGFFSLKKMKTDRTRART